MLRSLNVLLLAGCFVTLRAQQPQPASPQHALINQYCVGCHNAKLKTGGLALDTVNVEDPSQNPEVW